MRAEAAANDFMKAEEDDICDVEPFDMGFGICRIVTFPDFCYLLKPTASVSYNGHSVQAGRWIVRQKA